MSQHSLKGNSIILGEFCGGKFSRDIEFAHAILMKRGAE